MTGTLTLNPVNPPAGPGSHNVEDYGAKGDGVTNDAAAIQAAVDAAIAAGGGTVVFPTPGASYRVASTITIQKTAATSYVNFVGMGGASNVASIVWAGGNNSAVFHSYGWGFSDVRNLDVNLGSATGVVCWDIDADSTRAASNNLLFTNCHCNVRDGNGNIGWRVGHSAGWLDISLVKWVGCAVESDTGVGTAQIGWLWEGLNALNFSWFGCFTVHLAKAWSGTLTAGGGSAQNGGPGMAWFGCGGSHNLVDFDLPSAGAYEFSGGRFENGQIFLQQGGSGGNPYNFTVSGVELSSYGTGGVETVFLLGAPTTLILDGLHAHSHMHTAAFITANSSSGYGSIIVRGGAIQTAADPIYTLGNSRWSVYFEGVQKLDAGELPAGYLADRLPAQTATGGATFTLDAAGGTQLSVAAAAIATPVGNANNFSGLVLVTDTQNTGNSAVYLVGNGCVLVAQTGAVFSATPGNAGTINIYQAAAVLTVQNNRAATISLAIQTFRTRASG